MRIHGNRQLKILPGLATRPTPARVRAALFNIWQGEIEGCRWLDLCAGSGAMGAEALSRGAAFVLGIEQSVPACHVIQQNWRRIARPSQKFQVVQGEVVQQLKKLSGQEFDRIYFDPPYGSNLYQPVIAAISDYQLLVTHGEMAVEHNPKRPLTAQVSLLVSYRQKIYGDTALTFYRIANH